MWKIIIFIMFCMGFASMSFAQDNATNEATLQDAKPQNVRQVYWLTIDNKASFGATMSYPYIKDPDVYYNIGLTFGGNITKYLGMQTSLSITPPMGVKDYTDILIDVMLIVQKDMGLANSGFRPYFGIGIGTENSFAFLHNISGVKTGIGLATEAGLRYYYKNFLVGLSVNYHLYATSINITAYEIGYIYSDGFVHSEVKAGLNVGFLF